MPRTPEALSWSPQSTEQISRLIQALPPVIDLLLPKHSLSASCVPSPSSSPQVFPYSPHLKKAFPQLCSPSSYFTIFNLPFTAKPLQGVISMHTHCFLHIHSLPGPFAISTPSLHPASPTSHTGLSLTSQLPMISLPEEPEAGVGSAPYPSISQQHQTLLITCFPPAITLSWFSSSPLLQSAVLPFDFHF